MYTSLDRARASHFFRTCNTAGGALKVSERILFVIGFCLGPCAAQHAGPTPAQTSSSSATRMAQHRWRYVCVVMMFTTAGPSCCVVEVFLFLHLCVCVCVCCVCLCCMCVSFVCSCVCRYVCPLHVFVTYACPLRVLLAPCCHT